MGKLPFMSSTLDPYSFSITFGYFSRNAITGTSYAPMHINNMLSTSTRVLSLVAAPIPEETGKCNIDLTAKIFIRNIGTISYLIK